MAVETELKFRIPAPNSKSNLKSLTKSKIAGGKVGERIESDLVSTYFDTRKHKLKRHGISLRVRQDGENQVQTVKSANTTQFGRGEWETEIGNDVPDLGKADGTPLEQFPLKKLRRKLKPISRRPSIGSHYPSALEAARSSLQSTLATSSRGADRAPLTSLNWD